MLDLVRSVVKPTTFTLSLRASVCVVILAAISIVAITALSLNYYFSYKTATASALRTFQNNSSTASTFLRETDATTALLTQLVSGFPNLVEADHITPATRAIFASVIQKNPLLYAVYIGFGNGDFYELVNLDSSASVRSQLKALPEDRWVIIRVSGQNEQRYRSFDYFDQNFTLRTTRSEASNYDPRVRPWFTATRSGEVYKTQPYLFQHLQAPGQTYATRIGTSDSVLAMDITLEALSQHLSRNSQIGDEKQFIFQDNGELIAQAVSSHKSTKIPPIPKLQLSQDEYRYIDSLGTIKVSNETDWAPIDYAITGQPQGYAIDLLELVAASTGLQLEFVNGHNWPSFVRMFQSGELDLLQPVFISDFNRRLGEISEPILDLPYAAVTRKDHPAVHDMADLSDSTVAVPEGWSIVPVIKATYPNITILKTASPKDALLAVTDKRADATLDSSLVLHFNAAQYFMSDLKFHEDLKFNGVDFPQKLHLMVSHKHAALIPIINRALAQIGPVQRAALAQKWLKPNILAKPATMVPYYDLLTLARDDTALNRLHRIDLDGEAQFVFIAKTFEDATRTNYYAAAVSRSAVLAPYLDQLKTTTLITAAIIVVLMLVCWPLSGLVTHSFERLLSNIRRVEQQQFNALTPLRSHISEISSVSAAFNEMALAIEQQEQTHQNLIESLVHLIAQAIDAKSPYTATHCERVPELAIMLARAVESADTPAFKAFRFANDSEFKEFSIAAWLHDCGKITTPEHIIDKATKLETIYNRIHEIRTRFEVLWRDAYIDYLQQCQLEPTRQTTFAAELRTRQQQLQDDFSFVAHKNIGAEELSAGDIERLTALAQQTWQRHFDDRLGLATNELERMPAPAELPATEHLLADKTEHLIPRVNRPKDADKHGITMKAPTHLYNLGEVYNLSITRGTLTPEDRYKINEHMIATVRMLESLQFPRSLARVPHYASTHHETLNGSGYPRGLSAEQLTIPDRIIAIADIFEALTAKDRPYKKAKPISEAIRIMHLKVEAGDLDRDIFELFLRSGIYRTYTERFLSPAQMDDVDINQYLRAHA